MDEITCLKKLKDGEVEAFNILYKQYATRVYGFALSYLKSAPDAEGVVQEIFGKIWKMRADINTDLSFNSFIFTSTKNHVLNILRHKAIQNKYLSEAAFSIEKNNKSFTTEYTVIENDLISKIKEKVNLLPEKRKMIFTLSRFNHLTNKEISEKLNISLKTVENQINYALKFLRKHIGDEMR